MRALGANGRDTPRWTNVTCEPSTEPSVAVTGNVSGSRPAAAGEGPAIMPIDRGGWALIEMTRLPELRGAIPTWPVIDRLISSSTRNSKVRASSPGFSRNDKPAHRGPVPGARPRSEDQRWPVLGRKHDP